MMNTKFQRVSRLRRVGLTAAATFALAAGATSVATAAGGASAVRPAVVKSATAGVAKNHFLGAHPLVGNPGTGYCYIDVPHVHDYVPDRPAVFKEVGDDEYVFTGDPVPYGYEGDKTVFYGHHPVPVPVEVTVQAPGPTFCFIKGPHYHDYPQPEGPGFKVKDSAVFYVGPIPPEVARERPQIERAVEVEYQPYVALRPHVTVTPPPEWQGVVWVPPPSQPVVAAPPVQPVLVAPPTPQVVVAPPVQPVVVAPPPPQVVVAPPQVVVAPPQVVVAPPAPQVVVAPPAPRVVVAPPTPPVVVVAPPHPSVVVAVPHPGVVVVPPHPPGIIIGAPRPGVVVVGGHGHGWRGGGPGWHGGGPGWHGGGPGWKGGHGWKGGGRH